MSEKELFPIPAASQTNTLCSREQYLKQYAASLADGDTFWAQQAEQRLHWFEKWHTVSKVDYEAAQVGWFLGGKINVSYNCLDRHLEKRADKVAITWEEDSGQGSKQFTFRAVHREVCRIANVLKKHGVKQGDRVAIYMGMVPELAFSMLACARIGAIHSIIFGGFSQEAIRTRVEDAQCSVVLTCDEGKRGGKTIPIKATVDEGIAGVGCVKRVFVVKRTGAAVAMQQGRDFYLEEEAKTVSAECEAVALDSEAPLFILYTSGSTGKPKGVLHTQGGYLLYAGMTHQYVFDIKEDDVYFCAADIGWVTGHSYIVYGPLSNGTTTVLFESLPNYPDAGRYWQVVEKYKINVLYTAPTAIRALAKEGEEFVKKYDRSSLRVLGSVGEPINRDAWLWYYKVVGEERCAVVDTWWQTETGGILITPLPGATQTKPGSATLPFFGIEPVVVDQDGKEQKETAAQGLLCMKRSWPGQMRTVYGDHERFKKTYFSHFKGLYFSGDGCRRDEDGYYWITGRVDDVLSVAGHRFGTAELESNMVASGLVAEAAIVGRPHEVKGQAIYAYAILRSGVAATTETKKALREHVRHTLGPVAAPEEVQFVPGLPKTRSGKIMRRILRKIAEGESENFGDITTLADPGVVEKILSGFKELHR